MPIESKAAPYAADTRAKGWRFELDHERIRQSDTWALAAPDVRPWLLMLWMVSWEQVPCGSFPAIDELIAARIGMSAKLFAKHRTILLRGWWHADDGRLYHDTIVAHVLDMVRRRSTTASRVADYRARLRDQRSSNALPHHEQHQQNDTGTGTGTGTGTRTSPDGAGVQAPSAPARKRARKSTPIFDADAIVAEGVERQHAEDWLAARTAKCLPLTRTAWAETKAEAGKAGLSLPEAIRIAASHGWAGFRASWQRQDAPNLSGSAKQINRQAAIEAGNSHALGEWLAAPQEVPQ